LLFGPRRVVGFTGRHTESAARDRQLRNRRRALRQLRRAAETAGLRRRPPHDVRIWLSVRALAGRASTSPTIWTTATASTRQGSTRSTAPTRCHCFPRLARN